MKDLTCTKLIVSHGPEFVRVCKEWVVVLNHDIVAADSSAREILDIDDNFTETKARINIYAGAFKNRSKPKTDNQLGNQAGQYFANPGAVLG